MATNNPTPIGGNDPSVFRQIQAQNSALQQRPSVASAPVLSSSGVSLTPIVSGNETLFPQSTTATSGDAVTITSSVNNDSGDVTTVYTTGGAITVNPVNQTINYYTATDSGVSQIVAGSGVTITATGANGTGAVTINATGGGSNYTLPIASGGTLGGIRVGSGLSIDGSGILSTTAGNIAILNLDGNASNVLRGDGTFGPDANSAYGDSNVTSLLGAFGSNTIVTTGIITADGANLSNVPYANLTGAPTLGNIASINLDGNSQTWLAGNGVFANISIPSVGNIATINLDGNASNVLRGDGTFSADANSSYGDSNVTSLLGSFGSNTIVTTGIITADGANLSNVPYANLTGAPSLGNISSLNLDGNASNLLSGAGTYVAIPTVPTVGNIATLNLDGNSQTWLAGNGVFANISIPSVGNIAVINLDGNASNVLRGDGTFSADANSAYGDSNVTSLLGAFGSNTIVTTGIITADGANLSNVPYANLTGAPTLGNIASVNLDGNVSNVLTGNGTFVALPVINANTVVWSTAPVSNTSTGTAGEAAYDSGGNLYVCVTANTWAKFTGTTSW